MQRGKNAMTYRHNLFTFAPMPSGVIVRLSVRWFTLGCFWFNSTASIKVHLTERALAN